MDIGIVLGRLTDLAQDDETFRVVTRPPADEDELAGYLPANHLERLNDPDRVFEGVVPGDLGDDRLFRVDAVLREGSIDLGYGGEITVLLG